MKKYNLLSVIALGILIAACDPSKKNEENYFSFDEAKFKPQYEPGESVAIGILNTQNKKIDSVIYYVNDKNIASKKALEAVNFDLKDAKFGYQNLKAIVYFDGGTAGQEITSRIEVVSDIQPKLLNYTIVNTYPHESSSFIEGLEFYKDTLYEGTGQYGASKLLKTDYKTGKIYKKLNLENKYFGEGITIINDKIYQLTYKEKTGFIYNAKNWKPEKTFTFDKNIEGWGITNDGKNIYQSDGTEKIWTMNPDTQKMTGYINVYSGSSKIKSINELEWIDGKIYGNIWQKDAIAVINPATGAVEGVVNLADLRKQVKAPNAEVLNGIAYNPKTKTIFVTGKYWDKMFEIRVNQ